MGQSLTSVLIGAAFEGHPVEVDAPSYRHVGVVPSFERLGFRDVGMAGLDVI